MTEAGNVNLAFHGDPPSSGSLHKETCFVKAKKPSGKSTSEILAAALAKVVRNFNQRLRKVKFLKGKFVFLTVFLIILQVIQIILVKTVALPEVVFKWLFTGFCAVTAATKLLEEFLPFRAKFKAAKDDFRPYFHGKMRLEYMTIADSAKGQIKDFNEHIADLTGKGERKKSELEK